jgi:hypothetical protein
MNILHEIIFLSFPSLPPLLIRYLSTNPIPPLPPPDALKDIAARLPNMTGVGCSQSLTQPTICIEPYPARFLIPRDEKKKTPRVRRQALRRK